MENLPEPVETIAVPVAIPVPAYWRDHLVSGRVVLPAVEALQILARTLPASAAVTPLVQNRAGFSHLLYIDPGLSSLTAVHEFLRYADGRCQSRLETILVGRQSTWTRRVEHAAVCFLPADGEECDPEGGLPPTCGEGAAPAGAVFTLSRLRLYAELVPFGPAYQNVAGDVSLTAAGAWAEVSGGAAPEAGPLGSPFPADAAFHVACAWGQRYRNTIAFPVGFGRRRIFLPTGAGGTYSCRIVPLPEETPNLLRFDVWLSGGDGRTVEVIRGLEMRDISGGRRRPPAWVREALEA